jgi:hypothetical protein
MLKSGQSATIVGIDPVGKTYKVMGSNNKYQSVKPEEIEKIDSSKYLIKEEIKKVLSENTTLLNIPEDEEDLYADELGEDVGKNGLYVWVRPIGKTIKVHFDDIIHNKVTIEYEHNERRTGYGANVTAIKDTKVLKISPSLTNKFEQALEDGDYDTMIEIGEQIVDNL